MIIRNQLRSDGRLLTWRIAETKEEEKRAGMFTQWVRLSHRRREQLEAMEERVRIADDEIRTGVQNRYRTMMASVRTDREQGGAGTKPLKGEAQGIKEVHTLRSTRR